MIKISAFLKTTLRSIKNTVQNETKSRRLKNVKQFRFITYRHSQSCRFPWPECQTCQPSGWSQSWPISLGQSFQETCQETKTIRKSFKKEILIIEFLKNYLLFSTFQSRRGHWQAPGWGRHGRAKPRSWGHPGPAESPQPPSARSKWTAQQGRPPRPCRAVGRTSAWTWSQSQRRPPETPKKMVGL